MIDKLFEKCKVNAFLYKEAAFLGTLLSKMEFKWDTSVETACCNSTEMRWNPDWFISLPERTRVSILLHELWHIARLHTIRLGTRDPKLWNIACDFRINNDLIEDGYTFDGTEGLFDKSFDQPSRLTEEEIYDILTKDKEKYENLSVNDLDYSGGSPDGEIKLVQIVQSANEYAKSVGMASDSQVEEIFAKKLKPKIPWRRVLRQFFLEISKEDYSWKRPNRRYEDIYLPSMADGESLTTLSYYIDTSGSIDTQVLIRFNAELRSIWEDLRPKKIRVINFDTEIQDIQEISPEQQFNYFKFTGRGGTSLLPVMEHIKETKPTAAIIFSDLICHRPKEYPKVPIIWIVVNNPKATMPYGQVIHLEENSSGTK